MILEENFAKNLDLLLGNKYPEKIAVSFSGGADSLALLLLTKKWAETRPVKVFSIHIDHKLRKESSLQANEIEKFCNGQQINHSTLTWHHNGVPTAIQEKARLARQNLIDKFCKRNYINHVLTGHHFNDQIEQLLISLTQGAGIYSFLMPETMEKNGIIYYKPLSQFTKLDLTDYLRIKKLEWWEDSSNLEKKYLRNKVREMASNLLSLSNPQRLKTSFSNIKRASCALTSMSKEFIKGNIENSELGYSKLDLANFVKLPEEIRLSVLRYLIKRVGRRNSDIRLDSLKSIDSAFATREEKTYGGCFISYSEEKVIFIREFGRSKPPSVNEGDSLWDNRFIVAGNYGSLRSVNSTELSFILRGNENLLSFDADLTKPQKKKILLTIPSLFLLEKLASIYHIYNGSISEMDSKIKIKYLEIDHE